MEVPRSRGDVFWKKKGSSLRPGTIESGMNLAWNATVSMMLPNQGQMLVEYGTFLNRQVQARPRSTESAEEIHALQVSRNLRSRQCSLINCKQTRNSYGVPHGMMNSNLSLTSHKSQALDKEDG